VNPTSASHFSGLNAPASLTDKELGLFQRLMLEEAGITLSPAKKALVYGRLARRLKTHGCNSFEDYHALLLQNSQELQTAIDLLTTNETYFFREPRHFEFLREVALGSGRDRTFRVWSAACSSGEEVYTLAMILADTLGYGRWSVLGSDLNSEVLARARIGHYKLARTEGIPREFLSAFCLKGTGSQAGTLLIDRSLREQCEFRQINLNAQLPALEPFDAIFLRNVMIYFSPATKQAVVKRIQSLLRPGGYLVIGHSESLHGISSDLQMIRPSIYRRAT
jgi:chemotaxis protein methyltransferase CheR